MDGSTCKYFFQTQSSLLTLPLPISHLCENNLPLPNSHLCEIHMCKCLNCNGDISLHVWLKKNPEWSVTWTQCSFAFLICAMCALL